MQLGSHIPIRQLRRSSVNARPRGATPSGSCRFCRIHKRLCHLPPSLQILCFEALHPGLQAQPWGLRPLSRDISSGFSDSLFFPSALFNSLVRRAEAAVRPEPGIVASTAPRNT